MTRCAVLRSWLVEEHGLGRDYSRKLVALGAAHVLMRSTQRKLRPLLVIEQRRFPLHGCVALGTTRDVALGKLLSVNVLMAVFAQQRRSLEIHIHQLGFEVRRLVAIDTGRRTVGAQQGELRLRMIEARQFLPGLSGMARLAACERTVGPLLLHAFSELPFVRIDVAARAIQIFPVIDHGGLGLELRGLLVAVGTRNRNMPAGEDKAGLLMLREAECRGLVALESVATITCVKVRGRGELLRMLVGMTIGAVLELDLEQRVLPFGNVTLGALQTRVPPLQRVSA